MHQPKTTHTSAMQSSPQDSLDEQITTQSRTISTAKPKPRVPSGIPERSDLSSSESDDEGPNVLGGSLILRSDQIGESSTDIPGNDYVNNMLARDALHTLSSENAPPGSTASAKTYVQSSPSPRLAIRENKKAVSFHSGSPTEIALKVSEVPKSSDSLKRSDLNTATVPTMHAQVVQVAPDDIVLDIPQSSKGDETPLEESGASAPDAMVKSGEVTATEVFNESGEMFMDESGASDTGNCVHITRNLIVVLYVNNLAICPSFCDRIPNILPIIMKISIDSGYLAGLFAFMLKL